MAEIDHSGALVPTVEDYNRIFETLVDQDDDNHALVGYVAYVNYKIAKREWVRDFCRFNGRNPNQEELKTYISTWTGSRFIGLKTESSQILAAFAGYVVEQERPSIEKRGLQHRSFFREAGVACVGALFYTILLIGFALLLKVADIDAIGIFERVGVTKHNTLLAPSANSPSTAEKPAN